MQGQSLRDDAPSPDGRDRWPARSASRGPDNGPIYDAIRSAIMSGRYEAGDRLVEARIAAELDVSRTRIRDALARLEAEHLVVQSGTRGLLVARPSESDIEDSYDLRLLLEGYAARRAATQITTDELDHLLDIQRRMVEVEQRGKGTRGADRLEMIQSVTELNSEFHRAIQVATRNRRLEPLLRAVIDVPLMFTSFYWYSDRELEEAAADHDRILRALQDQDADRAEAEMRKHITRGLNTLRREIRGAS